MNKRLNPFQNAEVDYNVNGGPTDIGALLGSYDRVVVKPNKKGSRNVLEQWMMQAPHTKYVIKYDFNLQDTIIEVPEDCIIEIDCGSLQHGTLVGNNTILINTNNVDNALVDITIDGTWQETPYDVATKETKQNSAMLATMNKHRQYIEHTLQNGGVISQGMISNPDTIYVIKDDMTLGQIMYKTINITTAKRSVWDEDDTHYDLFYEDIEVKEGQKITLGGSLVILNETHNHVEGNEYFAAEDGTITIGSPAAGEFAYNVKNFIAVPEGSTLLFDGGGITSGAIILNGCAVLPAYEYLTDDDLEIVGNPVAGTCWFNGTKPLWNTGEGWVDALGNAVDTEYQTKVTGVAGNFAGFDADGNLADSGQNTSDLLPQPGVLDGETYPGNDTI